MKILVAAAKADFGSQKIDDAMEAMRKQAPTAIVEDSQAVNWERAKADNGGWNGAYEWASREYNAIVLVETADDGLGAGQMQLAQNFSKRGKRVGVFRDGIIQRVTKVEGIPRNVGNMQTLAARCIVE